MVLYECAQTILNRGVLVIWTESVFVLTFDIKFASNLSDNRFVREVKEVVEVKVYVYIN